MRLAPLVLLAGCAHAGLATVESTPAPGIHQTERMVRYAVRGRSIAALRDEMARIGPVDDGRHQSAHTWGKYAWSYPYAKDGDGCRTGAVQVELEIVQTFPAWADRAGADAATVREWDRWLAATSAHEDGHRRILIDAALALSSQLPAIAAQPDCDALEQLARTTGDAVLDQLHQRHADFDRETGHGAHTGAVLRN